MNLVIDVRDPTVGQNHGRWRLSTTTQGPARCVRTEDSADLTLDTSILAAAYLGGITLTRLAAAGLVDVHSTSSLTDLDDALATSPAPWAPEHF